jgi:hypothetical protein
MSEPVVEAIQDLTRVIIALQGTFKSKAEAIRRLDEFSIPQARIAAILSMEPKDVRSSLAKARKKKGKDLETAHAADAGERTNGEG